MQSNVVVVTEPDTYYSSVPTLFLVGCSAYQDAIMDNIRRVTVPITVYQPSENNSPEWIINAYNTSDCTILDCKFNDFITGFLIDKPLVWYYNNTVSYKQFNLNEVADPIDPLIKWISEWHINNQEKNAVYM